MIELRGLKKSIRNAGGTVEILNHMDLKIPRGQFATIMGPSGSGKSTLLGLIAGLDHPSEGEIFIDGEEIVSLSEDRMADLRGRKLGFIFQSYQLIPTLTAIENVLLPHELTGGRNGRERAAELLGNVGLAARLSHYPIELSGGEQQRVALARAFMMNPPILLADEPTGNLDSTNGALVLDLLLERNRTDGATILLVTHDAAIAARAGRCIVLRDGAIVEDRLQHQPDSPPAASHRSESSKSSIASNPGGSNFGPEAGAGHCVPDHG